MTIMGTRGGAARRRTAGFTLIELMRVLTIIGILAAVALGLPPALSLVGH